MEAQRAASVTMERRRQVSELLRVMHEANARRLGALLTGCAPFAAEALTGPD
jgi:hypothetical protein